MPETVYCWRCRRALPMLTDEEWADFAPLLSRTLERIKAVRADTGASLAEAQALAGVDALARYVKLTGHAETNVTALWHHRRSMYGAPCHCCGKPLRTKRAKHCAACGAPRAT